MKNACILILFVFLTFLAESSADLTIVGPNVSASASALEGYETYILETYATASQSQPTETDDAGYDLSVTVSASAEGKGYFTIHAAGDLHKYSSPYHPADETPSHVSALQGESKTVKVGSGVPIIIFSGLKSADVSAKGKLITDSTGKYEVKGKGKVDTSAGGGSGSAGGVGVGTSAVSSSGAWVTDTTSFRVSVVEVRPSPQANSQSGCANNPKYNNWCTDTGACTTRSPLGVAGECGHNYCCCAPPGSPTYNGNSNPPSTPSTPTSSTPDSDSADSSGSDSSDSSSSDSSSSDSDDEGSTFVGCGHTPSHTTVNFWGCGHSGFRCEAGDHGFVYCPTSNGKTCTVRNGMYQKCRPHTHTYD